MLCPSLLPTTAHHSPSVGDCPSSPARIFVFYAHHSLPPMPDAPASPRKAVSSVSQQARSQKKPGAPKPKGAVRAKSGCYTCRIRRKVRRRGAHHPQQSLTPISRFPRLFPPSRASCPPAPYRISAYRNATSSLTRRAPARRASVSAFSASDSAPSGQIG